MIKIILLIIYCVIMIVFILEHGANIVLLEKLVITFSLFYFMFKLSEGEN